MKKYSTREAIIKDIDAALTKVQKALEKATEHLDEEELLKGSNNVADLRKAREAADKQFRKIKRLQTVRLPALKEKLAEFDTASLSLEDKNPARDLMLAHQYLYYVVSTPIWGDYEYDKFCDRHGLEGNGGSDCDRHYSDEIRTLAKAMISTPDKYPTSIIFYAKPDTAPEKLQESSQPAPPEPVAASDDVTP